MAMIATVVLMLGMLLAGCATRAGYSGPSAAPLASPGAPATAVYRVGELPTGHFVITLVVTQDENVVAEECREAVGDLEQRRNPTKKLGCWISRPVPMRLTLPPRAITVVRLVEVFPSPRDLHAEAHETCHMVAALMWLDHQALCHQEDKGRLSNTYERRR